MNIKDHVVAFSLIVLLFVLALLIPSQRVNLSGDSPDTPIRTSQTSGKVVATSNLTSFPSYSVNRLAYVGSDGNIYVTTPDRSSTIAVTQNATTGPEDSGFSYHRISWSPDGRLAFAGINRSGDQASNAKLYVTPLDGTPARLVGESEDHFVIYIYWSPATCPNGPDDCRQLSYLIEEGDNIALRLVEINGDQVSNRVIGTGWPFYYSWAPDGKSMLWHTGGALRHNPDSRLTLYDLEHENSSRLPLPLGLFVAPAWSPQGERWLGVLEKEEQIDQLELLGGGQRITLDSASDSQTVFAWSPDGSQVAYARRPGSTDPFFSPIYIYDLNTGQSRRLTDVSFDILAFFWSPDGDRLAYLTRLALPNSTWSQWRVYDLANNIDKGFKAFNPSSQMHFVISSFNQYAQSHRFWSPDGRYLVYGNRDQQLVERVWIIDTLDNESGTEATQIGYGSFGTWSWE